MLEFFITYNDRQIHLRVPDNEDMKTLKALIQGETGIAPCKQHLRGFKGTSPIPPSDSRRLVDLNLPKENYLNLTTPELDTEEENGGEKEKEYVLLKLIDNKLIQKSIFAGKTCRTLKFF